MVGTMLQPPWNARIYRNRHGRGTRTPMFGTRLPRYRTRTGMFDDMVAALLLDDGGIVPSPDMNRGGHQR